MVVTFLVTSTIFMSLSCKSTATVDKTSEESVASEEDVVEEPAEEQVAEEKFDWKKYSGESIYVFVADSGQVKYISPKLAEFEELTGIKVEVETADASSYRTALPMHLTAKSSSYDVVSTFNEVDGIQFFGNGWYVPLDEYINDPNVTSPDWDFNDFPEGLRESMKVNGQTVSINWEAQTDLLYYRKDIFEEKGIEVPETFEDWEKVSMAVSDPENEFYGVALRGSGYQMTTPFSAFLYGYGGAWVDEEGNPTVNSEEAIDAFEMYGKLGNKYGPPGIVSFDWSVPSQIFQQGKVATFLDINLFVPDIENPDKSTVVGNVGYAPVPAGPAGSFPFIGGWAYYISPFSESKEAAWYFIQWATSKDINLQMKLDGWPSPRSSAWESDEFKAQDKTPEFTETVLWSYENARARMNPPISPGVEAREIVGVVGNLALEGASRDEIQEAANAANAELEELVKEMEK